MIDFKVQALKQLMPLGGWSYAGGVVTIHEDGAEYGYIVPSDEEIASVMEILEHNAPLLKELGTLDTVPRALEDLIPETDLYNYTIVQRKKLLREQLL